MSDRTFSDQMTSRERIGAALTGKPFDRIPCNCFMGEHAAQLVGAKISEMHLNADLFAAAQLTAYKVYRSDFVAVGPGLAGVAEAMGCELGFPAASTPYVKEIALHNYEDIETIHPADPLKDGRLPLILEAIERVADELKDEAIVTTNLGGPFTVAANVRGTENLMRDLYRNPSFVHRLLRLTTDSCLAFVQEAAKYKVSFSIAEPTASGSLLGAKQFREFVKPYLTELTEAIQLTGGLPPCLHICGNTKAIWDDMADTGAGMLSVDDVVDLGEVKAQVGHRVALVGNVRPSQTMYLGNAADVFQNAKECLQKGYDNPRGYILALGCGLPAATPPANIHALVEAARTLGRYPIQPDRLEYC